MKDLPDYFKILRHNRRSFKHNPKPSSGQFKSIYDTNLATGVFSHTTLFCNNGNYQFLCSMTDIF